MKMGGLMQLVIPYTEDGQRNYLTVETRGSDDLRRLRRIVRLVTRKFLGWSMKKSLIDRLIANNMKVVARRAPTQNEMDDLYVALQRQAEEDKRAASNASADRSSSD